MTLAALPSVNSCYSLYVNHWVCPSYIHDYWNAQGGLWPSTKQHAEITVTAVLLGLVLAIPLALVARRFSRLETLILGTSTMIYTIP